MVDVEISVVGDLGLEGFKFIFLEDSFNGEVLLVVVNEVSGIIIIYEFIVN